MRGEQAHQGDNDGSGRTGRRASEMAGVMTQVGRRVPVPMQVNTRVWAGEKVSTTTETMGEVQVRPRGDGGPWGT